MTYHSTSSIRFVLTSPNVIAFMYGAGWQAAMPFIPLHAQSLGMTPATVGLLMAVQSIAALFLSIPVGLWVDRIGSRTFALLALAIGGGTFGVLWKWVSINVLFGALLVLGVVQTVISLAGQMMVVTRTSSSLRDRAVANFFLSTSVGFALGPLASSSVVHLTGDMSDTFLVAAAAYGITCLFLLFDRVDHGVTIRPTSLLGGILPLARDVKLGLASAVVAEFTYAVWGTFFPLTMRAAGYSLSTIGMLFALRAFATAAIRPVFGWLVARLSIHGVLVLALFLDGVGLSLSAVPMRSFTPMVGAGLFGLGVGLLFPATLVIITTGASREYLGRLVSMRLLVNRVGEMIGPILMGVVANFSLRGALSITGLISAGVGFWVLSRIRADASIPELPKDKKTT